MHLYTTILPGVSKVKHEIFYQKGFTGENMIEWSPSSPDLNPIENLWSFSKMKLYEGVKQYNNKADLGKAIKTKMSDIEPAEVKKIWQNP